LILDKIRRYCDSKGYSKAFVMFGGGEPTLRPDLEEVLKHASTLFGVENVGFNSNGVNLSKEYMSAVERYVGTIEISIDGLEHYHNQWRDPRNRSRTGNPFREAIGLISDLVKDRNFQDKIEVSSIITKDNIEQLPELVTYLDSIGVRKYGIHRAMPVGRMALHLDKVLDAHGYVRLLLMIAEQKGTSPMKGLHLHHSLESIYSALFLGRDIHLADLPMASGRHSIGIDPMGNVFFDPWSVVKPYNRFSAGNLLRADADMLDMMDSEDSIIKIADDIAKRRTRCKACRMECGGGMRFNAMAHYISSRPLVGRSDIDEGHFLTGLSQIDPACPLYDE
jgi:MoaA/NifB/PqqE/SkfB family radical SAM enzyme